MCHVIGHWSISVCIQHACSMQEGIGKGEEENNMNVNIKKALELA